MFALVISAMLSMNEPTPGAILMAGGGETTTEMVKMILDNAPRKSGDILVLAQTREDPEKSGPGSVDLLKENGEKNVKLYDQDKVTDKDRTQLKQDLMKAKLVWIPGGNQNLFTQRWGVDFLQFEFKKALDSGASFFGTSAGSALMSNPMISGTDANGAAEMKPGIGLVPYLVDTHYRERNRQSRLKGAFGRQSGYQLAIGIDSKEAILYQPGKGIIKMIGTPEILSPK